MIEAGRAGGSAAEQAAQRRAVAARLQAEADWLDGVAVDERRVAELLADLPDSYVIVHDVRPPGSPSVVDHVVVGPGGAFLVAGRRYPGAVSMQGDDLVVGGRALNPELSGATAVAEVLAAHFATPVVPVLCLHGDEVPEDLAPTVAGVVVCAVADVARVLTRSTHTLLAPHKVDEIAGRARGLLATPVSTTPVVADPVATAPSAAAGPSPATLTTLPTLATVPEPVASSAAPGDAPATVSAEEAPTVEIPRLAPLSLVTPDAVPAPVPTVDDSTPHGIPLPSDDVRPTSAATPEPSTPSKPAKSAKPAKRAKPAAPASSRATRSDSERRARSVAVGVIVAACLVAAAAGVAARVLLTDDAPATQVVTTTTVVAPTTSADSTSTTVAGPLADGLEPPVVSFTAVCPGAGEGWNWVADWPGDVPGLDYYSVEFRNADGTWSPLAPLESSAVSSVSVGGQAPNVTITLLVTAVMTDGSTGPNQPTSFTSPASPC